MPDFTGLRSERADRYLELGGHGFPPRAYPSGERSVPSIFFSGRGNVPSIAKAI